MEIRGPDLLLIAEVVDGGGLEAVEGIVGGGEDGEALGGGVELVLDLGGDPRGGEQPHEVGVLPVLLEDPREVSRARRGRCRGRRGLG